MLQDSVPAGSYNDPFLSSVWCVCVCVSLASPDHSGLSDRPIIKSQHFSASIWPTANRSQETRGLHIGSTYPKHHDTRDTSGMNWR